MFYLFSSTLLAIQFLIQRNVNTCKFAAATPWCIYMGKKNNEFLYFYRQHTVVFVCMEKCPISRDLISVAGEPIVWLIKEILVLKTPLGGKNSFSQQPTLTHLTKTVKTWVRRNEKIISFS